MMSFTLDARLENSSFKILDWPLSEVRLKNNDYFPWLILIPRVSMEVIEIFQLEKNQQKRLLNEIAKLSQHVKHYFQAKKINVGTLGNIVSQLHVHVIARQEYDCAWPHSVWHDHVPEKKYDENKRDVIIRDLHKLLR